jgi:hypothetical protein
MCIGCTAYEKYLESIGVDTKGMSINGMFHSGNAAGSYSSGSPGTAYSSAAQGYSGVASQAYSSNANY